MSPTAATSLTWVQAAMMIAYSYKNITPNLRATEVVALSHTMTDVFPQTTEDTFHNVNICVKLDLGMAEP